MRKMIGDIQKLYEEAAKQDDMLQGVGVAQSILSDLDRLEDERMIFERIQILRQKMVEFGDWISKKEAQKVQENQTLQEEEDFQLLMIQYRQIIVNIDEYQREAIEANDNAIRDLSSAIEKQKDHIQYIDSLIQRFDKASTQLIQSKTLDEAHSAILKLQTIREPVIQSFARNFNAEFQEVKKFVEEHRGFSTQMRKWLGTEKELSELKVEVLKETQDFFQDQRGKLASTEVSSIVSEKTQDTSPVLASQVVADEMDKPKPPPVQFEEASQQEEKTLEEIVSQYETLVSAMDGLDKKINRISKAMDRVINRGADESADELMQSLSEELRKLTQERSRLQGEQQDLSRQQQERLLRVNKEQIQANQSSLDLLNSQIISEQKGTKKYARIEKAIDNRSRALRELIEEQQKIIEKLQALNNPFEDQAKTTIHLPQSGAITTIRLNGSEGPGNSSTPKPS